MHGKTKLVRGAAVLGAALTALAFLGSVRAAEGAKAEVEGKSGGELKIESKKEKPLVVAIDLGKGYGLPLESTETLGLRLLTARQKNDPIGLAQIATELAAYEKLSGKKTEVTSDAVRKEAVELARLRAMSRELAALSILLKDAAEAEELNTLAETVKKEEKERAAAAKAGEREKGIHMLTVNNHSEVTIHVHVNGQGVGTIPPFSQRTFHTHFARHAHVVRLYAHGPDHRWGPRDVHGHHESYYWNLRDDE